MIKKLAPAMPKGPSGFVEGTIVQIRQSNNGVLVRIDGGLPTPQWWGASQLQLIPNVVGPSVWERLAALVNRRRGSR
jgi:hypothetical protein